MTTGRLRNIRTIPTAAHAAKETRNAEHLQRGTQISGGHGWECALAAQHHHRSHSLAQQRGSSLYLFDILKLLAMSVLPCHLLRRGARNVHRQRRDVLRLPGT